MLMGCSKPTFMSPCFGVICGIVNLYNYILLAPYFILDLLSWKMMVLEMATIL